MRFQAADGRVIVEGVDCNSRYMQTRKQELLDALIGYLVKHGLADLSLRPMAAEIGTSARLEASPKGEDGSVVIHLDARVYASVLGTGERVSHTPAAGRKLWLQMVRGSVLLGDKTLLAGDGAAIEGEREVTIASQVDGTEFLLFDLP